MGGFIASIIVFAVMGGIAGDLVGYSLYLVKVNASQKYSYIRFGVSISIIFVLGFLYGEQKNQWVIEGGDWRRFLPGLSFIVLFAVMVWLEYTKGKLTEEQLSEDDHS